MSYTTDVLEEHIRELEDEIRYNKVIYDTHVEMIMDKNRKLEAIRKRLDKELHGKVKPNYRVACFAEELIEVLGDE